MGESIEQLLVATEDLYPLCERQAGGDEHTAPLVAFRHDVEEQLTPGTIEGHEAELIEDQQIGAEHPTLHAAKLPCVPGLEQRPHEVSCAQEREALAQLRGFDAERDREVGFADADRPSEDDVVAARKPVASRKVADLRGRDGAASGREVEGVEGLQLGKVRVMNTLSNRRVATRKLLDGERLEQVFLVTPVLFARLPRELLDQRQLLLPPALPRSKYDRAGAVAS